MPAKSRSITLLLPEGLTPDRYHALTKRLVERFGGGTAGHESAGGETGRYLVLSELGEAAPANMPVLNDSTWTLNLEVPASTDLQAFSSAAKALPDGDGVEVEAATDYRTSKP